MFKIFSLFFITMFVSWLYLFNEDKITNYLKNVNEQITEEYTKKLPEYYELIQVAKTKIENLKQVSLEKYIEAKKRFEKLQQIPESLKKLNKNISELKNLVSNNFDESVSTDTISETSKIQATSKTQATSEVLEIPEVLELPENKSLNKTKKPTVVEEDNKIKQKSVIPEKKEYEAMEIEI